MEQNNRLVNGISAEMELAILRELEALGVLVTCQTCGQCEIEGARCLTTVRGNGICGKSLMKRIEKYE